MIPFNSLLISRVKLHPVAISDSWAYDSVEDSNTQSIYNIRGSSVNSTIDHFRITYVPNPVTQGTIYYNDVPVAANDLIPASSNRAAIGFIPAPNINGAVAFGFHAVDAYGVESASAAWAGWIVAAVNDAPVAASTSVNGNQDGTINGFITGTDIDNTLDYFTITSVPANGVLRNGSTVLSAGSQILTGAVTSRSINLTFTPTADWYGTDSFTYTVTDTAGAVSAPATVDYTIAQVFYPVTDNKSLTVYSDESVNLLFSGSYSGGPIAYFVLNSMPNGASLRVNGADISAGYTVPAENNQATVQFIRNSGVFPDSWSANVVYSAYSSNGLFDKTPATYSVTILAAVYPESAAVSVSVAEGGSTAITLSGTISSGSVTGFKIKSLPATGSLTYDGNPVAVDQVIPASSGSASLSFAAGSASASFTYASVSDTGRTDTTPASVAVTVVAAVYPVTADVSTSAYTDGTANVVLNGTSSLGSIVSYKIKSLPVTGDLTYAGNPVTLNQIIPASGNQATLNYTNGVAGSASFTFAAISDASLEDATPATAYVTINAIVYPGTVDNSQSVTVDTDTAISLVGTVPSGTVTGFKIKSLPANGTLTYNSVAVTVDQVIPASANSAVVVFNSATAGTPTFTYAAVSNLGREDATPATITITVVVPVVETNPNLYTQLTYADNENIEEVSERFASLYGAASITGNKLSTTAAADYLESQTVLLDDTDFTIQTKFNFSASSANLTIIGVWTDLSSGQWCLLWKQDESLLCFYFRKADGTLVRIAHSMAKPTANTDHHIAVCRNAGITYLLYDGALLTTSTLIIGANASPASVQKLSQIAGGSTFTGTRWNTQVLKGTALYTSAYTVPASFAPVARAEYDTDTNSKLVAQVDLRRDTGINTANGRTVQFTNTTVKALGSRITTTASTSSTFSIPVNKWGAGDFTIEVSFNYSSVAAAGAIVLGHWYGGGFTHDDNRWVITLDSSRALKVALCRTATALDYLLINGPTVLLNKDYKVIVERVNGVVKLYVNGVLTNTDNFADPIRGEVPHRASNLAPSASYSAAGSTWDIRIADKALYNGVVSNIPMYPKPKALPSYDPAIAADIMVQCTFRNGNPRNEKTQERITHADATSLVRHGALVSNNAYVSKWVIPKNYFGAGDFTIETKAIVKAVNGTGTTPIIAQWNNGITNNSWALWVRGGTYTFGLTIADANGTSAPVVLDTAASGGKALTLNREHTIVVERVGSTVSLYLDGVVAATGTCAWALFDSTINISNRWVEAVAYSQVELRDIRMSKRAMYNGTITNSVWPTFVNKPSIVVSGVTTAIGSFVGGAEGFLYGDKVNNSAGHLSHTLYKDIRGGTPVTVRLVAVGVDRGSYLIIAWRTTDIPPTDDMPIFADYMKVGNAASVRISTGSPIIVGGTGVTGKYWSNNQGTLQTGQALALEFSATAI